MPCTHHAPIMHPTPPSSPTQPNAVRSLSNMRALVNTWSTDTTTARTAGLIVDARPAGRFTGTIPEPRAGMRSGHMPGAVNVPLTDMLTEDGHMKSAKSLQGVFAEAGVDPGAGPLVFSCGTGVTACGVRLGLAIAYPETSDSNVCGLGGGEVWGGACTVVSLLTCDCHCYTSVIITHVVFAAIHLSLLHL